MSSPTTADGEPAELEVIGSLSPSRAGDFLTCPLLYRFRTVDLLPEPTSPEAARGTLVHKVLEGLFDLPAGDRTPSQASALVEPAWAALVEAEPDLADLFAADDPAGASWLAECHGALSRYFTLEDPRRLEPAERELYVESVLGSRLLLRGIVDRVDVAPDGSMRIVDYKTGRSPGEAHEAKALFQLKFYGLVLWRMRGVVPRMLQLVYLGNAEILRYEPDEHDLLATERKIEALWAAIREAERSGDWQPRRSGLCAWCAHQALCPEFGGTPPPLPERGEAAGPSRGLDALGAGAPRGSTT